MDKIDLKELTKAVNSLTTAIKEQNKFLDKGNQMQRDNTEALKDLRVRLASVANAISNDIVTSVNQH